MQTVIYNPGSIHIDTTVTNGFCDYSESLYGERMKPEQYIEKVCPGHIHIPFDEALLLIKESENKNLCGPWEEITEEEYFEKLECLPPEKWCKCKGFEIFRMCEYYTGDITGHYVKAGDKYFTALRRTSTDYEVIANEIAGLI